MQLVAAARDPDTGGGCARPAACVRRFPASVILRGEISARWRKAASVRLWRRIAAACVALA